MHSYPWLQAVPGTITAEWNLMGSNGGVARLLATLECVGACTMLS